METSVKFEDVTQVMHRYGLEFVLLDRDSDNWLPAIVYWMGMSSNNIGFIGSYIAFGR